ncbi:MAG: CRISPR-associated helicase Cas3' [Acidobacteriota bacterium]
MKSEPRGFLAKAEERDGVLHWHPLVDHCIDVACCVAAILDASILCHRLARLGGIAQLDSTQVARLCVLALLHDVGKVSAAFQKAIRIPSRKTGGHVMPVMALLGARRAPQLGPFLQAIEIQTIGAWFGGDEKALRGMLGATFCHHGKPYGQRLRVDSELWRATDEHDWTDGVRELMAAARRAFPAAFEAGGSPLPGGPPFQHAWNGVLLLADWLGSDDTRFFPYTRDDDVAAGRDRIEFARAAAQKAVAAVGLDVRARRPALDGVSFERLVPGARPWPTQEVLGALELPASGGITVLEAPTGSGKTEAALLYALRLLEAGHVDGLYFALPTRAAASQLHRRVQAMVRTVFGAESVNAPPVALAVPGYLRVDEVEGERLARFDVQWPDEPSSLRGWAVEHPLRYFGAGLAVGTIDQALLSALRVKHSQMRAAGLLRHLLVVDEVHASDAYMTRILDEVIAHQRAAGGHVLLLSATLTTSLRRRLIAADSSERERAHYEPVPVDVAAATPYPLVVHRPWDGEACEIPAVAPPRGKRVEIELAAIADAPESLASRALDAARAGARVLVLRNTVRDCLETQRAVEKAIGSGGDDPHLLLSVIHDDSNPVPAPHHARFARVDRLLLDAAIERDFGKAARSTAAGRIAVATQTVEQSLDLDADLLLTDLCPIDVLLQRIGRLHRHERSRPAGFETARVVVTTPAERDLSQRVGRGGEAYGDHGLGSVYPDLRSLETTWRLLDERNVVELPRDNRALVERALHDQALATVADPLQDAWTRHARAVLGTRLAFQRVAADLVNDWSEPFGAKRGAYALPDNRKAQTRLGEDDILVRFTEPPRGPFGTSIESLTLRSFDFPMVSDDGSINKEATEGSTPSLPTAEILDVEPLRFRVTVGAAARTFLYDRLGIRPDETP